MQVHLTGEFEFNYTLLKKIDQNDTQLSFNIPMSKEKLLVVLFLSTGMRARVGEIMWCSNGLLSNTSTNQFQFHPAPSGILSTILFRLISKESKEDTITH